MEERTEKKLIRQSRTAAAATVCPYNNGRVGYSLFSISRSGESGDLPSGWRKRRKEGRKEVGRGEGRKEGKNDVRNGDGRRREERRGNRKMIRREDIGRKE